MEGLISKKDLIAMPGRISASGLEEQGVIQLPTVSESKEAHKIQGQEESQVALLCQQPLPWPSLYSVGPQAGAGFPREQGKTLCRRMILLI